MVEACAEAARWASDGVWAGAIVRNQRSPLSGLHGHYREDLRARSVASTRRWRERRAAANA